MILYSGEVVTQVSGAPKLDSIGPQMARLVRFAGVTSQVYTVLPHSLVVAELMPDGLEVHGLFHDVPEICIGDQPTPFKTEQAKILERKLLDRFYQAYDLPELTDEIFEEVMRADRRALIAEGFLLGHPNPYAVSDGEEPDSEAVELTQHWLDKDPISLMQDGLRAGNLFMERAHRYGVNIEGSSIRFSL